MMLVLGTLATITRGFLPVEVFRKFPWMRNGSYWKPFWTNDIKREPRIMIIDGHS